MPFNVTIDQFEGPLDLMLHLIKDNKLELFDLDISILTDQYLIYLRKMENLHLEVASEYLLELATLIEYKSKKLLPKDKSTIDDDYQEDPKERLIKRLIEYQKIKEVSLILNEFHQSRSLQLAKPMQMKVDEWFKENINDQIEGNPYDLFKAMNRCLIRMQLQTPIETRLAKREISIEDRTLQIKSRMKNLNKEFNFTELLTDCQQKQDVIVTFLAILDLVRNHFIYFTIDQQDEIWLKRG